MATTRQKKLFESAVGGTTAKTASSDIFAIGIVCDTNDPMQMGRVRVVVQAWGDSWNHIVTNLPWAMYVSPFGGQTSVGSRGPGIQQTDGGIAYGMWAIPKIGAQVLVVSLDEEHQYRLYLGCVYDAFTTHTLPHGRWISEDHPELDKDPNKSVAKPYGPLSSGDRSIQPLTKNLKQAFGNQEQCHEWKTRAADYSVSRVDVSQLNSTLSKVQDDKNTELDGWSSTQGYQSSRLDPMDDSGPSDKNYDSQVYSITSPGFHSFSMDDRMENCRMRFRTMSGHQIILDDTNERIYIATAQGNNWIELDQAGNIDIYTSNKVSIRAAEDINLTSDKSIRMHAKDGIHMHSDTGIRMHSKENLDILSDKSVKIESGSNLNLKAKSDIIQTGSNIHLNGPSAESADVAFFTNKVPAHEPYARCMTKKDDSHTPEFGYNDSKVGREERGKQIQRGIYWRR